MTADTQLLVAMNGTVIGDVESGRRRLRMASFPSPDNGRQIAGRVEHDRQGSGIGNVRESGNPTLPERVGRLDTFGEGATGLTRGRYLRRPPA